MSGPELEIHFSAEYQAHLRHDYGDGIGDSLQAWRPAPIAEQAGQSIGYVRLNDGQGAENTKPIVFVNGFLAGIVANAPFGADMASRGYDFILPDASRGGLLANANGFPDATYTQAAAIAAILEKEELTSTPLDVVTHSMGSLVFQDLLGIAEGRGWTCFSNAAVAMLAAAGVKQPESLPRFVIRWLKLFRAGGKLEKFADSYWRHEKEMFAAGQANLKANWRRALRDGYETATGELRVDRLLSQGVGRLALVTFAEDVLYSGDVLEESLQRIILTRDDDRITAFTPFSLKSHEAGIRGGKGADHSDQQFNPRRVGAAVTRFLAA